MAGRQSFSSSSNDRHTVPDGYTFGMPYAVIETTDALGNKELLAAPESWIQRRPNSKHYLCWPNVRNINSLNALLQDERSVPSLMWERHECVIKRQHLGSLELATKAIDGIQKQNETSPASNTRKSTQERLKQPTDDQQLSCSSADPFKHKTNLKTSQIPEMFSTLKRLIDNNQEEMTKKMNEGFFRIQKTMVSLMHKRGGTIEQSTVGLSATASASASVAAAAVLPTSASSTNYFGFNMKPLKTVEEMNDFEERLKDENYRKQVHGWIDSIISYERNPEGRMMEILDLMFDRHLLPLFSWTGASSKGIEKRAFAGYRNIISLYVYTGTTATHQADKLFVTNFFMKKLRHASNRAATLKGLRRCVPHSPATRRIRPSKATKSVSDVDESAKYEKIGRVEHNIKTNADNHRIVKIDPADLQDVIVEDHQYVDFGNIELKPVDDMQPTLFMSAEDESE
uniref:DUF4806 domain-containing protein n=1 Tax=Anopheles christyi TaxID=43041 RepID=A0A182JS27_9DIPT